MACTQAPTFANMTTDVQGSMGEAVPTRTQFSPNEDAAATTYVVAGGAGCDEMDLINAEQARGHQNAPRAPWLKAC